MNEINPIQANLANALHIPNAAGARPTVETVRELATQIRQQTSPMISWVNHPWTEWLVWPQAQLMGSTAIQMLRNVFLEPNEGVVEFVRKLESCSPEIRHHAREVVRFAISLNNYGFDALHAASHLLEQAPNNLLISTPFGPTYLSKQAIDVNLLYQTTGDLTVFQESQPADQSNLAALHAEWAQDSHAMQR